MTTTALIAQAAPPLSKEQKKQIAGEARLLWLVMAAICAGLVVSLALIATVRWVRRTKRLFAAEAKAKVIKDAWVEAGKRTEPEPRPQDEPDDDDDISDDPRPVPGGPGGGP